MVLIVGFMDGQKTRNMHGHFSSYYSLDKEIENMIIGLIYVTNLLKHQAHYLVGSGPNNCEDMKRCLNNYNIFI